MSVRSAIADKLIPDVHRVAPNANRGLVQQAEIGAIKGVGPAAPGGQRRRQAPQGVRR